MKSKIKVLATCICSLMSVDNPMLFKYVHQRDTCTALRNESKEKIRELDAKIKSCAEVIERSNTQLLEMEELERKAGALSCRLCFGIIYIFPFRSETGRVAHA